VPLALAPGETGVVNLEGDGIELTGELVAENQPPTFDYHFSLSYLVAKRPGAKPPTFLAEKGFDWKKGWSDSWSNSREGGAYLKTLHHWFVKPTPDGRFSISGVEPGDYEFAVHLYGSTEGCLVHPVATRVIPVTVKPGDSSLDLGKLSIPSLAVPKVGDTAYNFKFMDLAGSKTSLAAYRGKYVLVDFWATWCGPCVAKLDEVERLRKLYDADVGLVVVGANLDSDSDQARRFLESRSRPLPWKHALLGDWSATDVPRRFGITTVPAYVLIDPQGRIAAHEYSLDAMESKLMRIDRARQE
jgi:thiol-disulfide isomerase/thioredoxin